MPLALLFISARKAARFILAYFVWTSSATTGGFFGHHVPPHGPSQFCSSLRQKRLIEYLAHASQPCSHEKPQRVLGGCGGPFGHHVPVVEQLDEERAIA